jgi:hypothetical protein
MQPTSTLTHFDAEMIIRTLISTTVALTRSTIKLYLAPPPRHILYVRNYIERLTSNLIMAPVGKEIPPRATVEDEEEVPAEQNGAGNLLRVDSMSEVNLYVQLPQLNIRVVIFIRVYFPTIFLADTLFVQMFSRHESCLTSHLELTKCAMDRVVPDSDAFRAISLMLDRTQELMREVESIKMKLVRRGPCRFT